MFRTVILTAMAAAVLFTTGTTFGQPAKPAEPPAKPRVAEVKPVPPNPPADPKAVAAEIQALRARQLEIENRIHQLLASMHPNVFVVEARMAWACCPPVVVDCCPAPRCCLFGRLFHRGGGCGDPCAATVSRPVV